MAERFVGRFRKVGVEVCLVINPKEQADAEKCKCDRDVGDSRKNERAPAPPNVHSRQHSLHHVLVGSVRSHGNERRTNESGKNRVLDFEHAFPFVPTTFRGVEPGRDDIGHMKPAVELGDFVPASGNRAVKQTKRNQCAAHHDGSLNEIGPNNRLDSADGSVDRSQDHDHDRRADVDEEGFSLSRPRAANHFVSEHECNRGDVKPCARSEQAGEHENGGGGVFGRDAKPRGQIFVDRENFVIVVGLDENVADENAGQDRAKGQLDVGVIPQRKTFAGRSEESAGARFGGDDRGEDCPPGNLPATESEVFQVTLLAAHAQADENDDEKIKQENRAIDGEPSIHVDLR